MTELFTFKRSQRGKPHSLESLSLPNSPRLRKERDLATQLVGQRIHKARRMVHADDLADFEKGVEDMKKFLGYRPHHCRSP